jgi:hypothetical protein
MCLSGFLGDQRRRDKINLWKNRWQVLLKKRGEMGTSPRKIPVRLFVCMSLSRGVTPLHIIPPF